MPKEPPQDFTGTDEHPDNLRSEKPIVERSYYYDDTHGYEEYDPKRDTELDEDADEFDD